MLPQYFDFHIHLLRDHRRLKKSPIFPVRCINFQSLRCINLHPLLTNVRPADKSLKKIQAKLTALTGRNLTPIPLSDIVGSVNRSLRGWANYFHYRNSSAAMSQVRQQAEDRLRTHLMKRHTDRNRKAALCRFPRRDLYERYGLYKPPTVAGWNSAHALA